MKKYQCSRVFYEFSDNNEHVISLVFFKFSEKKLILKERWFFICFVSISQFVKDFKCKIQKFLSQPFFVAEVFTGSPGKYVKVADTIAGFKEILNGNMDNIPEQAFYMVGGLEEVHEKAKKLQAK